jgi:hypothetical protein
VQEDTIHEPVELIDEDLDTVAGGACGGGVNINIDIDVNVASIVQLIVQVETTVFGSNSAAAVQGAAVLQTA